jgi:hypothetical protein
MAKLKPLVGHYSTKRSRLGNWLIGRRAGKSRIRVLKDLEATANLTKAKRFRTSADGATIKIRRAIDK